MKNKILASLFVLTFIFATTLSAQTPVTTSTTTNVKKTECKHDGKCKDKKTKCCKQGDVKKAGCCKDAKAKEGCKGHEGKACCKGQEGKAGCKGHGNAPADSSACPHHKKAIETGTPDNK